MIAVNVFEQSMFGATHFRVMREDGRLIFDRHQTDFPSREDASIAINGEFRRNKLGAGEIRHFGTDRFGKDKLPHTVTPIDVR